MGDVEAAQQGLELSRRQRGVLGGSLGEGGLAVDLTPREAQIAGLAARGMSNQEIAEELVLSVRSVETCVYRAMQKRGVSHRSEL